MSYVGYGTTCRPVIVNYYGTNVQSCQIYILEKWMKSTFMITDKENYLGNIPLLSYLCQVGLGVIRWSLSQWFLLPLMGWRIRPRSRKSGVGEWRVHLVLRLWNVYLICRPPLSILRDRRDADPHSPVGQSPTPSPLPQSPLPAPAASVVLTFRFSIFKVSIRTSTSTVDKVRLGLTEVELILSQNLSIHRSAMHHGAARRAMAARCDAKRRSDVYEIGSLLKYN